MPRACAIDHIALVFSDLKKAEQFFVKGLGLTVSQGYPEEIFMNIGQQKIALFHGKPEGQNLHHLGLLIDDYKAVTERLQVLGYIVKGDMVEGPEGIRVQLVEKSFI